MLLSNLKGAVVKVKNTLADIHSNKYVPYHSLLGRLVKYRHLPYRKCSYEALLNHKKSDTIFILGSGPSLNQLDEEHWQEVARHDSFGLNFSCLKPHIPTFYQPSYHRRPIGKKMFLQIFKPLREKYTNTVWMLSAKARNRIIHPRITPELFPVNPIIYQFSLPKALKINPGDSFTDEDFKETVFYRGTLTFVLDFSIKLGYKKIVLLGVDPDTWEHFFFNIPEMHDYVEVHRQVAEKRADVKFESMIPKSNKGIPIDQYYYSVCDYLNRIKNIKMYIGFKNNMLAPRIPSYFC